jgi:hypothetical protein
MAHQVMKLLELRRINAAEHVARIKVEELVKLLRLAVFKRERLLDKTICGLFARTFSRTTRERGGKDMAKTTAVINGTAEIQKSKPTPVLSKCAG